MINLKTISLETKEIEVAYPGIPDFKVKLSYLSRAASKKLSEASKKDEWINSTVIQVQDDEKFLEAFVDYALKGWSGLTVEDVSRLMLVEIEGDGSEIVEYSKDNAITLMQNSSVFEGWVTQTVFSLDNFRSEAKKPTSK